MTAIKSKLLKELEKEIDKCLDPEYAPHEQGTYQEGLLYARTLIQKHI